MLAQSEKLPFKKISENYQNYTSQNVIARFVDGLGYRYFWATEGLREEDLNYTPSENSMSTSQTLKHIYDLSNMILNAIKSNPNVRVREDMDFITMRKRTLWNLKEANELVRSLNDDDLSNRKIIFSNGMEFSFWHLFNGPLADAIYHVGQIVSFRRTSGNPINAKVNVFMGKNNQ